MNVRFSILSIAGVGVAVGLLSPLQRRWRMPTNTKLRSL
jgi:hypothetical protein